MKIEKVSVSIGGTPKHVAIINVNQDKPEAPFVRKPMHHIFALDRSGSMTGSLSHLIDQVIDCVGSLPDDDLISILYYSSHNQCEVVVQGAKFSAGLVQTLNRMRTTLGMTCFSEPLKKINSIVELLESISDQVSVTFFTDGCPVVTHISSTRENELIFEEIDKLKSKVLALNAIGYGNYYNGDLLLKMSQTTDFGRFYHCGDIAKFKETFLHVTDKVQGLERTNFVVETIGESKILQLTSKSTRLVDQKLTSQFEDPKRNIVFIVSDTADLEFTVNGESYSLKGIKPSKVSDVAGLIQTFYYAYAYELYYLGRRLEALDIVGKNIKDKALVDQHLNSFTRDEVQDYLNNLESAVFDPSARMIAGATPPGYIPSANAPCVIDLLMDLRQNGAIWIPFSNKVEQYKRVTRKVEDQFNLFTWTKEEIQSQVSTIVFNKDKLNLSLQVNIPGTVTLNKKSAERVGLDKEISARIVRNYTFIKDGNLNVTDAEFILSPEARNYISSKYKKAITQIDGDRVLISFKKLPVVNRSYIDQAADLTYVYKVTDKVLELEGYSKVLKYFIEKTEDVGSANLKKTGKFIGFNADQIAVLSEHGLTKDLIYSGVDRVSPKVEDCDYYEARQLVFQLKGSSTDPKVEEMLEHVNGTKKKKTVGPKLQYMINCYNDLMDEVAARKLSLDKPNKELYDLLTGSAEAVKTELGNYRDSLAILKISKVLSGDWFQGLQVDDKGNEYFSVNEKPDMFVKSTWSKVYVTPESEAA